MSAQEFLVFFGRFLRNPRQVGSVAPSSRALAREMVRGIPADPAVRVVELGPGTGVFTQQMLEMRPDSAGFLAIDIDAEFCARLRARWPQLALAHGSAADLPRFIAAREWPSVQHVISGLPFTGLPGDVTAAILDAVKTSLAPGGAFTTFQYLHMFPTPPAVEFRRKMEARFGALISKRRVVMNFPPAYVLTWRKPR